VRNLSSRRDYTINTHDTLSLTTVSRRSRHVLVANPSNSLHKRPLCFSMGAIEGAKKRVGVDLRDAVS